MRRAGLLGEGAVQVLHSMDDFQTDPILAAVGALQFEVVQARAAHRTRVRLWLCLCSLLVM